MAALISTHPKMKDRLPMEPMNKHHPGREPPGSVRRYRVTYSLLTFFMAATIFLFRS
jgi:hypothetical protein